MYYKRTREAKESITSGMPVWEIYREIAQQQNVLIAGTTGSGKSTALRGIIYGICADHSPTQVDLWLADPKRVDLIEWLDMGTPHLARYANTTEEIKQMIDDLVQVMENRYAWMEKHRVRTYTDHVIHLIVDELGDLIMNDKRVLHSLTRILQLGRACGIRSILCTQSPSRHTIPAPVQVNMTATLALRCKSAIESRQIMNMAGAEMLPKYGKGLFLSPDHGLTEVYLPLQEQEDIDKMIQMSIEDTKY